MGGGGGARKKEEDPEAYAHERNLIHMLLLNNGGRNVRAKTSLAAAYVSDALNGRYVRPKTAPSSDTPTHTDWHPFTTPDELTLTTPAY